MPHDFELTPLWRRTLAPVPDDPWAAPREALRAAYLQFRSTVEPLAGEIAISMPMFTDHSITHIDALWDTASIICGEEFPLNPAEAFVLGGTFLLHDLGMGLAAFPGGLVDLESDPLFRGLLSGARDRLERGELAADKSLVEKAAHEQAVVEVLRRRHAEQAGRLLTTRFPTSDGVDVYLLPDVRLRLDYGSLIGRIAESHWWDVADLKCFAHPQGSRTDHPPEWIIDPLKITCVLRLADAAHIDDRRAPSYLHAFRRPVGHSRDHWYFQERLARPQVDIDRLVYTSTRPFTSDEAAAWWLAYETIKMIDNELRRVDALCADLRRPRFPVRSVAGADSPDRLAEYIQTDRWQPIDASLRVSNVNKVIDSLGGQKLYGPRPDVALRELIANASDATQARCVHEGTLPYTVTVTLLSHDGEWWLTVKDHGIGMKPETMVSALTDFGFSRWQSADMIADFPDLTERGFRPTGRFGIGFFAIFMISDKVAVQSLAYGEAPRDTHVLEFRHGVTVRPLLRKADRGEWLHGPGTIVTAKLRHDPRSVDGLFRTTSRRLTHTEHLHALVSRMCALSRVNIDIQGPDDPTPVRVINANDWTRISPAELFDRVYRRPDDSYEQRLRLDAYQRLFLERAEDVRDDNGEVIGHAMVVPSQEGVGDQGWYPMQSVIYVGGLEANNLQDTMGVFSGTPLTANRLTAFPTIEPERLTSWMESQAERVRTGSSVAPDTLDAVGDVVRGFGATAARLPCALAATGQLDQVSLANWLNDRMQVRFVDPHAHTFFDLDGRPRIFTFSSYEELLLPEDCLLVSLYHWWRFPAEIRESPQDERFADAESTGSGWDPRVWWYDSGNFGSIGLVVHTIAQVWGNAT
jgi:Histidine kinase-, DNA gyrase B-, and HSP90-like ATPase